MRRCKGCAGSILCVDYGACASSAMTFTTPGEHGHPLAASREPGLPIFQPRRVASFVSTAGFRNVAAVPKPREFVSPHAVSVATDRCFLRRRTQRVDAPRSLAPTAQRRRCRQRADRSCRATGSSESGAARSNAATPRDARAETTRIQGTQDGSEPAGMSA